MGCKSAEMPYRNPALFVPMCLPNEQNNKEIHTVVHSDKFFSTDLLTTSVNEVNNNTVIHLVKPLDMSIQVREKKVIE